MTPSRDEIDDRERATLAEPPRYEPPAIQWEEPLEAVARFAAACAKMPSQSPQCDLGGALAS